jgi:tetratricopeptide (TPR) repeat protein
MDDMHSIAKRPTTNPVAYELYLKGLYARGPQTHEALDEAIRYFEMATKKDPKFSLAYSAWGNAYVLMGGTWVPYREVYPRAKDLVARALELDRTSSDAHLARGNLAFQCEADWKKAETELQEAISLNPGNAEAHFWYGMVLLTVQRFDEAKEEFREMIRLNPGVNYPWTWLALAELLSGDLYGATSRSEELLRRNPESFIDRLLTAHCYLAEGRTADALKEAEKLSGPPDLSGRVGRAILFALLGKPEEATRLAKEMEERAKTAYVPPLWIADLYAVLDEKQKALEILERDFREGDKSLWMEYQYPQFARIRNEPRFVSLLRGYKLPAVGERTTFVPHVMEGTKQPVGVPT